MAINGITFRHEGRQCFVDISQTAADTLYVRIRGYQKKITEKKQTINLTPYLLQEITADKIRSGILIANTLGAYVQIQIGNSVYSDEYGFYWGEPVRNRWIASDLPYRVIDCRKHQTDFITAMIEGGDTMYVTDGEEVENDVLDFGLCAAKCSPSYSRTVEVGSAGAVRATIPYIDRPMGLNGVRLAWLNRYGAVEMWNFDHLREKRFTTTSEIIYTHKGYQKLDTKAETIYTVESREETDAAIDALSYIIASPKVWLVHDDGNDNPEFEEISIVTEECKTFEDNNIFGLQVSYRKAKREL